MIPSAVVTVAGHGTRLLPANESQPKEMLLFSALAAHFVYTRQRQKGVGDAVVCAENSAGEEPFVAALGDPILGFKSAVTV